ncbi:MAG: NADH-quinone oxidoreductase subunit N [Chloroflexi bacterium]|nr:NADH-quinone oxidoreductase subunit N [Chloroflexota bacterium]MDA8188020.1 NADH-quinone oxidoreductase subunit N [Dehalococcoidales bacterium]
MNLNLLLPEISLCVLAVVLIVIDLLLPQGRKSILGYIALVGLAFPAVFTLSLAGVQQVSFSGALVVDQVSVFFKLLFLIAAALVILSSFDYTRRLSILQGEYYALVLFATSGMMLMASTRELISIYIALEFTSITLYVLAASIRNDAKSSEAGLKYLLLGALSSGALLYGMALTFGLTGSTVLNDIASALAQRGISAAAVLGLVFIAAGFGFKIATVPFHMWAPDVYEGAPTPITAFLSVASKAAGFALVLRVFLTAFEPAEKTWLPLFMVLAAVTMTLGNFVAIRQTNIKRMLAYSSIAHAGYVLTGLAAATAGATSGMLVYLLAYTLTNLGAFIAIIAFSGQVGSDQIEDYNGLSRRAPVVSLGLAICLLSLAGVPPMAGFISKVYLFAAVFDAAAKNSGLYYLVVIALLNSAVSIFYYLRVVKAMYFGPAATEESLHTAFSLRVALSAAVAGVLIVGIYPTPVMQAASVAAQVLFH